MNLISRLGDNPHFIFLIKHQLKILLFLIISAAFGLNLNAQTPNLIYVTHSPSEINIFDKGDSSTKKVALSSQAIDKYGLLDILYYDNSLIVCQRSTYSPIYYINQLNLEGTITNSFEIQFPKKPLATITYAQFEVAIDGEGYLYVRFVGKEKNEQYGTEYLRKYSLDGNMLWERVASDNTELKWVTDLFSLEKGIFATSEGNMTTAGDIYNSSEESERKVVFWKEPTEGFDQTIFAQVMNAYSFKPRHLVYGADKVMYVLTVKKEGKGNYAFIRTDVLADQAITLGGFVNKPDSKYYGVVDEAGNTIIYQSSSAKIKDKETGKKVKVYNAEYVVFDPSGKKIHASTIAEESRTEPTLQRPILATNGHLLYLDNGKIIWAKYGELPGTTIGEVSEEESTNNMMLNSFDRYWYLCSRSDSNGLLFRISQNKYAILTNN